VSGDTALAASGATVADGEGISEVRSRAAYRLEILYIKLKTLVCLHTCLHKDPQLSSSKDVVMADPSATSGAVKRHLRMLLALTFISRLCLFSLVNLSSLLPLFDSSPRTIPTSKWIRPLLRWDAFHFARIADHGYIYEYEWAFFPGVPWLMWGVAQALRLLVKSGDPPNFLLGGAVAALACDTTCTLYHLSLHHLGSPSLAFLASILSLIPSSPATLRFAAYSEPFFTYLSYKGVCICVISPVLY